ncbi:MAG TPA: hypothetical protein VGD91_00910 [Trebonia sp.]
MVHAAVRPGEAGPARPGPVSPGTVSPGTGVPGRLRRRRLDLVTTPGRLRLLLAGLVLLSLAWGALAAFTAVRYASAASSVVAVREPLSLDAQQIYSKLSDANDAAVTAFLTVGVEPAATRQRYLGDISAASAGIERATAQGGAVTGTAAADLSTLAQKLTAYTGEIETARADNRLGLPVGAAYLREAAGLMRDTLLPRADDLYAAENAGTGGTSAQATGLPLVAVTLVAGLVVGYLLYRASRWLRGRTNRVLNLGLVAAGLVVVISLVWLAAAYASARGDLLDARARGSATVEAVAQVSIAAQEAHADESLTLIDNTGNDKYDQDYSKRQAALGPGPGTLLGAARAAAQGTPAQQAVTAAAADASAWFAAHLQVRSLDNSGQHPKAVASALGTKAGDAGASFARLSADLAAASDSDQAVFNATAHSAASAYTGLEPGLILAALIMAAACAWGVSRRLAEYR